MATTSIFVSPGVYTREQDFSVYASSIGVTRLGLVCKTAKGPAFEAIKVSSTDDFLLRFGETAPELPGSYVANAFLSQTNDLTMVRVLGYDGYNESRAWLITADYDDKYSGTTTQSGITFNSPVSTNSQTYTFNTFTDVTLTMSNNTASASTAGNSVSISISGIPTTTLWYNAIAATSFSGLGFTITSAGTYNTSIASFTLSDTIVSGLGQYSGSTLCVLRSKKDASGTEYFNEESDVKIGNVSLGLPLTDFVISGTTGPLTAVTNSGYTFSLDETKDNYIVKTLGKNPKVITGMPNLYVEKIYPHFVREAKSRGDIYGLSMLPLVYKDSTSIDTLDWSDFAADYTHAQTPWVVSRVAGGAVSNLFKFHMISDGDASNSEVKISIANIDPTNYTFDVIVRSFSDTDATASQSFLERFSNVNLDETAENFIGKMIGTNDEEYPIKSSFISLEFADSYPDNAVPAGFRGYELRGNTRSDTKMSGTCANIYYKTSYLSGDTTYKTYLGISELGYTNYTSNLVGTKNSIKSIESDLFVYEGTVTTGKTTVKGFHLESTAPPADFILGAYTSLTGYTNTAGLTDKNKLKFTLVPYGGFDGFNKYMTYSDPYLEFYDTQTSNVNAFKAAIDVLSNPEETDINVFATPGVDFYNNSTIVKYALDMVETRADSFYIIDAPRITVGTTKGTPEQVINLLESTGIDSNYAATYWPWIQVVDSFSGKYTYQPPTLMVARSIAFTDNTTAQWYAVAGLNRGGAPSNVIKVDVKLSSGNRDTLYNGRVNPIASFVQQGIVIWGQKTLQLKSSALDRINVRRLLLQVRRLIAAASQTLVFEQNDQTLRDQFLARVEPILLQVQSARGLYAFKVVMDNSNNTAATIDQNTLVGKIQLKPTRTCEVIDLTFSVLPTGANFSDF